MIDYGIVLRQITLMTNNRIVYDRLQFLYMTECNIV